MNRFLAIAQYANDQPDVEGAARRFLDAILEAKGEGVEPTSDPAVMLIGAHISFLVNADVSTSTMYRDLIDCCSQRAAAVRNELNEAH